MFPFSASTTVNVTFKITVLPGPIFQSTILQELWISNMTWTKYQNGKYGGALKPHNWSLNPEYDTSHLFCHWLSIGWFPCLSFNRRGYNAIAWKMKDLLIYTWKTDSSTGLFAELCVYIIFKGLDLSAPAASLQTLTSLKPVRAGNFPGYVYRKPIQLVNSIHLMGGGGWEKKVTSVGGKFIKLFL